MRALIIGASGATGKDLTETLLADSAYAEVVLFVRRPTGNVHPKLVEVITDFDHLEAVSDSIKGDVWFSCLGTTLSTAGSKEKQWRIDFDIPAQFAEIAKRNGIPQTVLLSAYGANPESTVFYSKMKGRLEAYFTSLSFDKLLIFRPGLLLRKDTDRLGEKISAGLITFLNAIGIIKKFKPMPTATLAEKMAKAPKIMGNGKHVIELEKIFSI